MRQAFVSWQSPGTRIWHVIGQLQHDTDYLFRYTQGVEPACEDGFEPLLSFPDLQVVYRSASIFPIFANRIMPAERPEYQGYLQRLALTSEEATPMEVLVRSTGIKATDNIEIIGYPTRTDRGCYQVDFPVRSIRYLPAPMQEAVLRLVPNDRLYLLPDPQNHMDPGAVAIRTEEIGGRQETYLIGYCPIAYARDFRLLLDQYPRELEVKVLGVNPPPAPSQSRLLCRLSAPWPEDFEPFHDSRYNPITDDA